EPAAGVADVGEVDVASDDVGDVVAVDLAAQRVGDVGQRLQVGPVRGQQGEGLVVGEGGRVAFGLPEGGGGLAGPENGRGSGALSAGGAGMQAGGFSPGGACGLGWGGEAGPFGYLVPVAVDLGEVFPAVMGTADGVDGDVQVRAAGSVLG